MKRKKWRYTEHIITQPPTTGMGWVKLILTHIVISPLRIVNEISQKILFLGKDVIKHILKFALFINAGMIVWHIILRMVGGRENFIPIFAMLLSLAVIAFLYYLADKSFDFQYQLVDRGIPEAKVIMQEDAAIPVVIKAFEDTAVADVSFSDPINIFITDPDELDKLYILPAVYQEAEDKRILNAIENASPLFPSNKIEIPDLLSKPPLGSQLEDNFSALMQGLEQQLAMS